MSKEVTLKITIDQDGKIHMSPEGTVGTECLDLMKCVEEINGFHTEETILNNDAHEKYNQIVKIQKLRD